MNRIRTLLTIAALLLVTTALSAQDLRTAGTKVADLLARMPADNPELASRLMEEMYSLGEEGRGMICGQIVPAGTGDDLRARYAVSALTARLSADTDEARKRQWEKQCIDFMKRTTDREVRSFFMRQLNLIGSELAVKELAEYVTSADMCDDAVIVLQSVGTEAAASLLYSALRQDDCPCAAQAMVALAETRPGKSAETYMQWYSRGSIPEKSAALYAIATTGVPEAGDFLNGAAAAASYRWEPTGAVQALLLYAKNIGLGGEVKKMERITKQVIDASMTPETASQRLAAMSVITAVKGNGALGMLLDAAGDTDVAIRGGALRLASGIPGSEATMKWIKRYSKVSAPAKSGILYMLGERGDQLAAPLIIKALDDPSPEVSSAAVSALARLKGPGAVDQILSWIMKYDLEDGYRTASETLTAILDSTGISKIAAALPASKGQSTVTLVRLLAWSGDRRYFRDVFSFTSSPDYGIRAAAITSLTALASYNDQPEIIGLLEATGEKAEVAELQRAILAAAMDHKDPSARSALILEAMDRSRDRLKLIPLLSATGGGEALKRVAAEFENGDAITRDVCFDVLTHWNDISSAKILREITASGNKTFGMPAFDAYMRMVSAARLKPERKLLMIKDMAPYAADPGARAGMVALAGSLEIRQTEFFITPYLSDPSEEVRSAAGEAIQSLNLPGDGSFEPMFNGNDLAGWKGLVGNPVTRAAMTPKELAARQKEADRKMLENWSVRDGMIWFSGVGDNLCSVKEYGDFELYVDWKITRGGDSGIYLRGTPQVQIWDTSRTEVGAQVGSGGLYNNQKNSSVPLLVADNPAGEWNTFRILMTGDKVTVWLNGDLVTDEVTLENYWDRSIPVFRKGSIELQAHGTDLAFRDIYIREINTAEYNLTEKEKEAGFISLFNGMNLDGWIGDKVSYAVEDGMIVIRPGNNSGGNLYTGKEYSDFIFRFEFQLTPGANNGLGIRTPPEGDAAYAGMEIQILDNTASIYSELEPYQYHGSVYGVIPARRGFLRPVGEWNYEEVTAKGTKIKVVLNGAVIVDSDLTDAIINGPIDGREHPGLKNSGGHIGFLGHGSVVRFRNIRIREL
jgi:HEAT repeat protein